MNPLGLPLAVAAWIGGELSLRWRPEHLDVPVHELRARLPRLKVAHAVVDLRDTADGALPRAVHVPLADRDGLVALRRRHGATGLLIVYDADGSQRREAEHALRAVGCCHVWYLEGGHRAWVAAPSGLLEPA